uniref:Uncharacterized protein n=1 Tax=Cannabis sativa TaxID=3483 RepID=A0A803RBA0_CANSA
MQKRKKEVSLSSWKMRLTMLQTCSSQGFISKYVCKSFTLSKGTKKCFREAFKHTERDIKSNLMIIIYNFRHVIVACFWFHVACHLLEFLFCFF